MTDLVAPPGLRALPSVQRLLELPEAQALCAQLGRPALVAALRAALEAARGALRQEPGAPPDATALLAEARSRLQHPALRRVINATGIMLHTNLGRAPLAAAAVTALTAAAGYCTLEFDLDSGGRGSRTQGIEPLLRRLTGAEAAMAVNNCAAGVLLALSALAEGGEVIVSRGELVEIGGGFRIPEVIQQGGARLVEVGTTNKTRIADYRRAVTPATRVLLKVHQSNFRLTGFTEETTLPELTSLAAELGLIVVHDLGSGAVVDLQGLVGRAEPTVQEAIAAGADVVVFSGDKLLGGPQSGLLAGRAAAIDTMRRHPLTRALRLDKLCLAALEATLRIHCAGEVEAVPVLRQLRQTKPVLLARAEALAARLGAYAQVAPSLGYTGGGTLPDAGLPSFAVALHLADPPAETLAACLRAADPPLIGRIADGHLRLDMLTVADDELDDLVRIVLGALAR